jgi:hypothetical protein
MVMTTPDTLVIEKVKAKTQAGELIVKKGDAIIPSKLNLLAAAGWSIQDAWREAGGGFRLLLTREVEKDDS